MSDFLLVLAVALLPALGNIAGGLLAEAFRISKKALSLSLHLAAGVVIAVVATELMPKALGTGMPWLPILGFFLGTLLFIGMDQATHLVKSRVGGREEDSSSWMIYLAVAIDLFSDGVMIGTGSTLNPGLGFMLALGQIPADVPEGFATIATFKNKGMPRAKRILLTLSLALPILLGANLSYWLLRDQPEIVKMTLLALTAGILATLVIEEIVPQAHADGEARLAALFFGGGFSLFSLLGAYFG